MNELQELLKASASERTFWLLALLGGGKILKDFLVGAVQWYWKRQSRLESAADYQPQLVKILEGLESAQERQTEILERLADRQEAGFIELHRRLDKVERVTDPNLTLLALRRGDPQ